MNVVEKTILKDVDSGMIRAMEVRKVYKMKDRKRIEADAAKRKKRIRVRMLRKVLSDLAKCGYLLTILFSSLTAMGLLNRLEELSQVDFVRLMLCIVWIAVPMAVLMVRIFKEK